MDGFFKIGDKLHSVWSVAAEDHQSGATVGYDEVTEIVVDKAAGPMGWYAVALVYREGSLWQALPLHMMAEIVVEPRTPPNSIKDPTP